MQVQFALVGHVERPANIRVDLPSVPAVGDVIQWPGISQADTVVRTVVWYLTHDDEGEPLTEPFAYVVVGPSREESHGLQAMHQHPVASR